MAMHTCVVILTLQIVSTFIERQRLGVVASTVTESDEETTETKEFLNQMLRTGQRLDSNMQSKMYSRMIIPSS